MKNLNKHLNKTDISYEWWISEIASKNLCPFFFQFIFIHDITWIICGFTHVLNVSTRLPVCILVLFQYSYASCSVLPAVQRRHYILDYSYYHWYETWFWYSNISLMFSITQLKSYRVGGFKQTKKRTHKTSFFRRPGWKLKIWGRGLILIILCLLQISKILYVKDSRELICLFTSLEYFVCQK